MSLIQFGEKPSIEWVYEQYQSDLNPTNSEKVDPLMNTFLFVNICSFVVLMKIHLTAIITMAATTPNTSVPEAVVEELKCWVESVKSVEYYQSQKSVGIKGSVAQNNKSEIMQAPKRNSSSK